MALRQTLGNGQWLRENEQAIKDIFPKIWTHGENLNGTELGHKLRLLGIDWRSEQEFVDVMVYMVKIGMLLREGRVLMANPKSIFK